MTQASSSVPTGSQGPAALAVFSSRENIDTLCETVQAALMASAGVVDHVDVLVNGNPALAEQMAARATGMRLPEAPLRLRVWFIPMGDKSHTWNEYVERLLPPGRAGVFVDGYAAVEPQSLQRLLAGLARHPDALAATGVPTVGWGARRDARQMREHGGIHGNLYALSAAALAQLRALRFRLPLGLYRTDPTLGAALNFGLDLGPREWRPMERVHVCADVHWRMRSLRWWHPEDLKTHFRRVARQAQGDLENAAVRHRFYLRREEFGALPRTAAELVSSWAAEAPAEFNALLGRHRHAREAYERMMAPRDWSAAAKAPQKLADIGAAATEGNP